MSAPRPVPAADRGPDEARLRAVEDYYDETWFDFRTLWMDEMNRALHFGWWDATVHTHAESLSRVNQIMAGRAAITADDRVLDAGCGVGGSALWLADNVGAEVVGVTIAGEQVFRATRYARDRGLDHLVRFEQQDYAHTTFPDGSFSVVWAQESFCHAADHDAFLAEAARLLRPGGRLILHDYLRTDPARPSPRGEEQLRVMVDGWVLTPFPTAAWLRAACDRAGFGEIAVEDTSGAVGPSLRHLYLLTLPFSPVLGVLHRRGWRSDTQHGNTAGSLAQWRAFRRGQWHPAFVLAWR